MDVIRIPINITYVCVVIFSEDVTMKKNEGNTIDSIVTKIVIIFAILFFASSILNLD